MGLKGRPNMINCKRNQRSLARLQATPLDLRRLNAPEAVRALFGFLQQHFEPGDECSLWSPAEAKSLGDSAFWRVSWESGPLEWGVLLTLGESMWLQEARTRIRASARSPGAERQGLVHGTAFSL